MPTYTIEGRVFELFPEFRRGVVIATGMDNHSGGAEIAALLAKAVSEVTPTPSACEQARISVWNTAFTKFGADPNKYTPSIRFLYEQIRRGKPPRSINKAVDAINLTSITWGAPCGGDDLNSLDGGDLCLGIARGDETFAPLFKPYAVENPIPGEVIYFTPQTRRTMCRRWTWRNSDFSRLKPETKAMAVNIDMMVPPFNQDQLDLAIRCLEILLRQACRATVRSFVLSRVRPVAEIAILGAAEAN
jgi:DNA/RNA-binding domain of Phe-tRNA-synthetase-like protein